MKRSSSGFGELKKLQQTVAQAQAQARRAQAEAVRVSPQTAPIPDEDAQLFRRAMQAVTPLKAKRESRVGHTEPSAEQLAKRRAAQGEDPPISPTLTPLSDQYVPRLWTHAGCIAWLAPDMAADTVRRLQRGAWPVQARVDLHGMRSDTAREALVAFLADCLAHGVRCVRIIHGKGYGSLRAAPVLREKTPAWLMQHAGVCAFVQAPPSEGGEGALLALLRSASQQD